MRGKCGHLSDGANGANASPPFPQGLKATDFAAFNVRAESPYLSKPSAAASFSAACEARTLQNRALNHRELNRVFFPGL
jgi:hypothetical protein